MVMMSRYPDKHFDLAIVDPPYGIDASNNAEYGGSKVKFTIYKKKDWDKKTPCSKFFDELFRVSKNQIIWGGNYFTLPVSPQWILWDKLQPDGNAFGKYEMAWNSSNKKGRIFKLSGSWNNGGDSKNRAQKTAKARIHPTQKPVKLYKWLLDNYANPGDKILDTHLGSMSIAIACHDYGFELTGCELDEEYYKKGIERVKNHVSQQRLFDI